MIENKSWFILLLIHSGLALLFCYLSIASDDPWAFAIFILFLTTSIYCGVVWEGNRFTNNNILKKKRR